MRVLGPIALAACLALVTITGLFGRDPLRPDPEQPRVSAPERSGAMSQA